MGFLTAGYNIITYKLEQLRWSRTLSSVTRQHMKVQKQIKQQQSMMTQMKNSQMQMITLAQQKGMAELQTKYGVSIFGQQQASTTPMDLDKSNSFQAGMQAINMWAQGQKLVQETAFEAFNEAQLEPLHQLEEQLVLEKEHAQIMMETAKQNYDAAKDERKSTSKDMIAEYNG